MSDKKKADLEVVPTAAAGAISDYHTILDLHGRKSRVVETWLADDVEKPAAPVLASMARETRLPREEREREPVAKYLAVQMARVTAVRASLEQFHADASRMVDHLLQDDPKVLAKALGRDPQEGEELVPLYAQARRHVLQNNGLPVDFNSNVHVSSMLHLADAALSQIYGRPWLLVRFRRRRLFTSDRPVVGTLGEPFLTFPLDRQHLLVIRNPAFAEPEWGGQEVVNPDGVDEAAIRTNARTWEYAHRWIYFHPDDLRDRLF